MNWTTLISAEELAHVIDRCIVVDARHDLMQPQAGALGYAEGHIPGARFVAMDADLSAAKNGRNGRHPMPSQEQVRALLAGLGLQPEQQLVVYDTSGGLMASRLWWMARWVGHARVAVLDGGLPAWQRAGYPVTTELPTVQPCTPWPERAPLERLMQLQEMVGISAQAGQSGIPCILDARSAERFRGETEPMDPVAGHIPGSLNRPSGANLRENGCFKPAQVLAQEFRSVIGDRPGKLVIQSCGSGVSACHNQLAMVHAGMEGAGLYGGSWSEWCSDPARPVAVGP
ncbi:MAG: 3-mercaptopyruvate sulfurtransferase [Pseudomonadota bacterium]|jgi:thiosulfate/3-mercaptopyruvate sulfurtransferase